MSADLQTWIALAVVAAALTFLIRRVLRRRQQQSCDACGPDRFKASLKR